MEYRYASDREHCYISVQQHGEICGQNMRSHLEHLYTRVCQSYQQGQTAEPAHLYSVKHIFVDLIVLIVYIHW